MAKDNAETVRQEALFLNLVLTFQAQAMQQMGKLKNPFTDKIERDLQHAELSIDMLEMLKSKTKKNLSSREKDLIDKILSELKMNFMDEKAKEERGESEPVSTTEEAKPEEASADSEEAVPEEKAPEPVSKEDKSGAADDMSAEPAAETPDKDQPEKEEPSTPEETADEAKPEETADEAKPKETADEAEAEPEHKPIDGHDSESGNIPID